jgi:aminoglycoside N3'-acetyltransferase
MNQIKTEFPFYNIINILIDIVGKDGNILFPCWQSIPDFDQYNKNGSVFDVKRTPTCLGIIPELARHRKGACRSLSPYSSVVAIGADAEELVKEHHLDELSCGVKSPFYKLVEKDGFILGLGVTTRYLSFVHCIEDCYKGKFPLQVRYDNTTPMRVKTFEKEEIIVNVRLPHPNIKRRNIPGYLKKHIDPAIAKDLNFKRTNFFIVKAKPLFTEMQRLAKENITIYY